MISNQMMNIKWTYRYQVNGQAMNKREFLGNFLRWLAQRIDHRPTLAYRIHTKPRLCDEQVMKCIDYGVKATERAIRSECRIAAEELGLEIMLPTLFKPKAENERNGS